jgi:hypothetical protein
MIKLMLCEEEGLENGVREMLSALGVEAIGDLDGVALTPNAAWLHWQVKEAERRLDDLDDVKAAYYRFLSDVASGKPTSSGFEDHRAAFYRIRNAAW